MRTMVGRSDAVLATCTHEFTKLRIQMKNSNWSIQIYVDRILSIIAKKHDLENASLVATRGTEPCVELSHAAYSSDKVRVQI
jgi:hypothetical protein